jgi:hypothetical protein
MDHYRDPPDTLQPYGIALDNSGDVPLQVPGFGDIPIHFVLLCYERFAHGILEWRQAPAVTAREFAMVAVMEQLTDRPGWDVNIFDDQVVADWRKEVVATNPLISEKAWTLCVKELRDKALDFREKQHIRVLDTGTCVCKSDTADLTALSKAFQQSVPSVLEQQQDWGKLDWRSNQVLSLIDPSLFPLIYGRSPILLDGGKVDLQHIWEPQPSAGVSPKHFDRREHSDDFQKEIEEASEASDLSRGLSPYSAFGRSNYARFYPWSSNYQFLPCEVDIIKDSGTEVQLTSYINNLHPMHTGLYQAIEKLVSLAIEPWNECLVKGQPAWGDVQNQGQLGLYHFE